MKLYSQYTLLMACACFQGHEEAKFLVEEMKVDINEQAQNKETALIRAVHFNDKKMVKILLDFGASTELRTMQEVSPLITAVTRDKPKLVDLLLKNGCCINLKSKNISIEKLLAESSEEVKNVIDFHKAWRRKKNMLIVLEKLEENKKIKKDIKNDPLKVLNKRQDL
eukprot:CAMPEP_0205813544 /NCGR_PEP_ID=MMETSP0205-20121125/18224_1 /ASSEMBLY_ACC=CAM_ASM_000278 /TAXON_ID=36767 /ORGANISM="Euplotes focardii, Strain TN1" /LENGTH=166 /DNA_ID=CAMNT_0053095781 /DNA_START=195 /DNA_END=692 /DNA_ORIENTATION=+